MAAIKVPVSDTQEVKEVAHELNDASTPVVLPVSKTDKESDVVRIQFMSDIHIEFPRAKQCMGDFRVRAPILALLGDIGIPPTSYKGKPTLPGAEPKPKSTKPARDVRSDYPDFLLEQAARFDHVLVLAGNHEFYGGSDYTDVLARIRYICSLAPRKNIHFLDRSSVLYKGVRISGATLWSHVPDENVTAVERGLNDYVMITLAKKPLRVKDSNAWHREDVAYLQREIETAKQQQQPLVILTHHTPSMRRTSNPIHDGSPISCAFSTELTHMCGPPVKAWLYGHTHFNNEQRVKGTLVGSNQQGYMFERDPSFDGERVLTVPVDASKDATSNRDQPRRDADTETGPQP